MQFKVYGNRIVLERNRYFLRNASECVLGAWGKKKSPLGQPNYLDRQSVLGEDPKASVPVSVDNGPHEAVFDSTFKLSHIGNLNLPIKLFNLGIDDATKFDILRSGACTFYRRDIDPHALTKLINRMPKFREMLQADNSYRFVTSVIWLKSATITTNKGHDVDVDGDFSLGINMGGKDDGDAPKQKGKGSLKKAAGGAGDIATMTLKGDDAMTSNRNLTFEYAPDTVMAYGLHKIVWDSKNKKKRDLVESMEPDWQGLS